MLLFCIDTSDETLSSLTSSTTFLSSTSSTFTSSLSDSMISPTPPFSHGELYT